MHMEGPKESILRNAGNGEHKLPSLTLKYNCVVLFNKTIAVVGLSVKQLQRLVQ